MSISYTFVWFYFFFFKQKTAYEMRISDWSSDVCSSDLDNSATSGDATSSNDGSSGDAMADGGRGGDGGNGNGGDAYAGAGTGGDGGRGGAGGTASANAGSFDMSNAMNGSSNAAAGIMMVAQHSGASSLIQQGVTVQANPTLAGAEATSGASRGRRGKGRG